MENKTIEKNWTEIKTKIKAKWNKISDDEIEAVKGNFDALSGKLQKVYSLNKDLAEKQFSEFKGSIESLLSQDAAAKSPQSASGSSTKSSEKKSSAPH